MFATPPTGPLTDETVRMRTADLPRKPLATHVPSPDVPRNALPKPVSGFDGKTVRLRPVEIIGTVSDTVRQRYINLATKPSPPTTWAIARVLFVLLLASMPILAIPVEVFGLVHQSTTSIVIIALLAVLGAIIVFAPHRIDMVVGRGLIAGMVACIVYDAARLFAVHVLNLMGDFIPVMGSFVTGEPETNGSAAVGYVWRYIGDGGGMGVAFFIAAFALGIDRWKSVYAVLAFVAMSVFPLWSGLIGTVVLAPRGEEMMFDLNPATFTITLVGHLIFGLVLGLAFLKAPRGAVHSEWPWPPILESAKIKRMIPQAWRATHRAPRA